MNLDFDFDTTFMGGNWFLKRKFGLLFAGNVARCSGNTRVRLKQQFSIWESNSSSTVGPKDEAIPEQSWVLTFDFIDWSWTTLEKRSSRKVNTKSQVKNHLYFLFHLCLSPRQNIGEYQNRLERNKSFLSHWEEIVVKSFSTSLSPLNRATLRNGTSIMRLPKGFSSGSSG